MTYESAYQKLETAKDKQRGKPIANNTRLVREDDAIAVRLHDTNVVTFHADGSVTLNSGGWRTVTTTRRINSFAPVRVYSKRGTWYATYQGKAHVFADGMRLYLDGRVEGAGA